MAKIKLYGIGIIIIGFFITTLGLLMVYAPHHPVSEGLFLRLIWEGGYGWLFYWIGLFVFLAGWTYQVAQIESQGGRVEYVMSTYWRGFFWGVFMHVGLSSILLISLGVR